MKPSLSQKSRQVALVTRLPDQQWASSWASSDTRLLSPARIVGDSERQPRVLHAAEREARRQHQHVVAAPAVRAVQPLGRLDHLLQVGELGGRLRRRRPARRRRRCAGRAGGTPGRRRPGRSGTAGSACFISKRCSPVRGFVRVVGGAHDGQQPFGVRMRARVGDAHAGRILQRNPAAGVDRLRLREQERVLLAGRLLAAEPLQAAGLRAGGVVDADGRRLRPAAGPSAARRGSASALPTSKRPGWNALPSADVSTCSMSQLPRVEDERLRRVGVRSTVSVAWPWRRLASKSTVRSRSTWRTRTCSGRA